MFKRSLFITVCLSLGACENTQCHVPPVHPSACAKTWLKTLEPPYCAKEYFDRLGDQQEALGR